MEQAVLVDCSFEEKDWFFYNIVASSNCPIQDVSVLMWEWTLPDVLKLREFSEMRDAYEEASNKDEKLKSKK